MEADTTAQLEVKAEEEKRAACAKKPSCISHVVDIGGGVLRQPAMGLEWTQYDNRKDIRWDEAVSWCSSYARGWRLPTSVELSTLIRTDWMEQNRRRVKENPALLKKRSSGSLFDYDCFPGSLGQCIKTGTIGDTTFFNKAYIDEKFKITGISYHASEAEQREDGRVWHAKVYFHVPWDKIDWTPPRNTHRALCVREAVISDTR